MKPNTEKVAIKNEELTVKYDVSIPASEYLLEYKSGDANLPAPLNQSSETIIDIIEDSWDKNINKADKIDYLLAIASGTIAAAVDIFYTGEFSLEEAERWGKDKTNDFIFLISNSQKIRDIPLKTQNTPSISSGFPNRQTWL